MIRYAMMENVRVDTKLIKLIKHALMIIQLLAARNRYFFSIGNVSIAVHQAFIQILQPEFVILAQVTVMFV